MSAPRVAVVGGGIAGSFAAMVLRSRGALPTVFDTGRRGAGGRLAGGRHADSGAQFLLSSEGQSGTQLHEVMKMLSKGGIVQPWTGRFGLLGGHGGFLPSSVVSNTDMRPMVGQGGAEAPEELDFCGFLNKTAEMHVGIPSNAGVCANIIDACGAELVPGAQVLRAVQRIDGRWALELAPGSGDDGEQAAAAAAGYDALVLATHDPTLAAETVRSIAQTVRMDGQLGTAEVGGAEAAGEAVDVRLDRLASALDAQRAERTHPLFTWSGYYDPSVGLAAALPFDAAVVPSGSVHFLCRDASKPGRPATRPLPVATAASDLGREAELWTAVSSTTLAKKLLGTNAAVLAEAGESDRGGRTAAAAAQLMSREISVLLAPFFGGQPSDVPPPRVATAKRWSAALPDGTLGLQEACVGLEPWRLAIAGDFLQQHSSPAQAAMLSGLDAGERVADFFAPEEAQVEAAAPDGPAA